MQGAMSAPPSLPYPRKRPAHTPYTCKTGKRHRAPPCGPGSPRRSKTAHRTCAPQRRFWSVACSSNDDHIRSAYVVYLVQSWHLRLHLAGEIGWLTQPQHGQKPGAETNAGLDCALYRSGFPPTSKANLTPWPITACLTDAVRCLAAQQNRQQPLRLESRQLAALKAEIRADTRPDIRAEILTTLAELGIAVPAPAPPDAPEPLTPIGPPPTGQKYCKRGHTYPTAKKECPQCAAARKRRHRHTQAQKRAGTIPTAHVASTT